MKVAQAQVSAKEKALADAQPALTAKTAAFCKNTQSHIIALDRHGGVLNQTAPNPLAP